MTAKLIPAIGGGKEDPPQKLWEVMLFNALTMAEVETARAFRESYPDRVATVYDDAETLVRQPTPGAFLASEREYVRDERGRFGETNVGVEADVQSADVAFDYRKLVDIPDKKEREAKWGKTASELEASLGELFPNAVINVAKEAMSSAAHREVATGMAEGLAEVAGRSPEVAASLAEVNVRTIGVAPGEMVPWTMTLNLDVRDTAYQVREAKSQGYGRGMDAGDYAYGIAVHEMGHAATTVATVNARLEKGDDSYSTGGVGHDHRPDVFDAYGSGSEVMNDKPLSPEPEAKSEYANSNPAELRAEAYAYAVLSGDRRTNKEFLDFIDKYDDNAIRITNPKSDVIGESRAVRAAMAMLSPSDPIVDRFGKGSIAWAYATRKSARTGAFDESKHVREKGRFTFKDDTEKEKGEPSALSVLHPGEKAVMIEELATGTDWGEVRSGWGETMALEEWNAAHNSSVKVVGEDVQRAAESWSWGTGIDIMRESYDRYRETGSTEEDDLDEYTEDVRAGLESFRDGQQGFFEMMDANRVDAELYRGQGVDEGVDILELAVGDTLPDGLTSWSRDPEVANLFADLDQGADDEPFVSMTLLPGARGVDIAALATREYAWQEEVVVGGPLTVVDIKIETNAGTNLGTHYDITLANNEDD